MENIALKRQLLEEEAAALRTAIYKFRGVPPPEHAFDFSEHTDDQLSFLVDGLRDIVRTIGGLRQK